MPQFNKSFLYVMNVDWDWVKQRPHFLAEGLSLTNEVLVLYPYSWRRSRLVLNPRTGVIIFPFFRFPFGGRLGWIKKLNALLLKGLFLIILARNKFDFIWVSAPDIFESLPSSIKPGIIYDCMDDVVEFKANSKHIKEILENEKALIKKSSHIFCSSLMLKKKLLERGAHEDKCTIIFNALDEDSFTHDGASIKIDKDVNYFHVGYFGTISEWFDFELVNKTVLEIPEIIFYLVGPIENINNLLPVHDRIIFIGPMNHKNLKQFSSQLDLLVMPFHVSNLVLSVDPVKLYEYIFFNRPVLSVFYPGLERFEKFIHFYEGHDQFILKIKQLFSLNTVANKYSESDREIFLRCNSWKKRLESISYVLDAM